MSIQEGRRFWKMSGSGNDFIFFDERDALRGELGDAGIIDRLCSRAMGIGADGVVFLQTDPREAFRIRYFNRDGSLAELCGNASLCSARLAVKLGLANAEGFRFHTDAGLISARITRGEPEIDLQPVRALDSELSIERSPGELRMGFADTGVPHLVVLVESLDRTEVVARGRALRHDPSLPEGANVNFVARDDSGPWRIRTYERGVEGETLACGTGSVAAATLLMKWGLSGPETALTTKAGRVMTVTVRAKDGRLNPSLRGEGRIVFVGQLADV